MLKHTTIDYTLPLGNSVVLANGGECGEGSWLRLAEYGEYLHAKGLQKLTRGAGRRMMEAFRSLWGRMVRTLGGIPVYAGHPDDPDFRDRVGHRDRRPKGWVADLCAKEDGLWARVRWTKEGRQLVGSGEYRFLSPRWRMRILQPKVFEPFQLLSIGLTNHPNIPGTALSNERPERQALPEAFPSILAQPVGNSVEKIERVLAEAWGEGRLLAAHWDCWRERLRGDFEGGSVALSNAQPALKLEPVTAQLKGRDRRGSSSADLLARAEERFRQGSGSYAAAWVRAKRSL